MDSRQQWGARLSRPGRTYLLSRALQALHLQRPLCHRHSVLHSDMAKQAGVQRFSCALPGQARLQLRLSAIRIRAPPDCRGDLHGAAARPAAPDCRRSNRRQSFTTAGAASWTGVFVSAMRCDKTMLRSRLSVLVGASSTA